MRLASSLVGPLCDEDLIFLIFSLSSFSRSSLASFVSFCNELATV